MAAGKRHRYNNMAVLSARHAREISIRYGDEAVAKTQRAVCCPAANVHKSEDYHEKVDTVARVELAQRGWR